MKAILITLFAAILFISCSKSDGDPTTPTPPTQTNPVVKQITVAAFENANSSGIPTTFYLKNTNTGESIAVMNQNAAGIYTARFRGLNGHSLTNTPRPFNTNLVVFDAGVGDTIIISKNGVDETKAVFVNDNLSILNGGVLVTRFNNETNEAAGQRINSYSMNEFPLQKFKPL
jgi:hypothetical protein